jgi:hypothetical protein
MLLRLAGKAVAVVKGLEAAETVLQVTPAGYQAVKAVGLYISEDVSQALANALETTLRLLGIAPRYVRRLPAATPKQLKKAGAEEHSLDDADHLPTARPKLAKKREEAAQNHLIDVAGPPVDPKTLTGPNRGIFSTTERSAMRPDALEYQSSLPGTATDMKSRKLIVPGLRYDNPNPKGKNHILFDGLDLYDETTLVDRKLGIVRSPKQEATFRRWAEALRQNSGFKIRIEVPNARVKKEVNEFLNALKLSREIRDRLSVVEVPFG